SCENVKVNAAARLSGRCNRPDSLQESHELTRQLDKPVGWCQSPQKYLHPVHSLGLLHTRARLHQTRPHADVTDSLPYKSVDLNLIQNLQLDKTRSCFVHRGLSFWPGEYCHVNGSPWSCRHVHASHQYSGLLHAH